jgi:2,4'-dihydroxyacetophenone dioxygenase
MGCQYEPFRLGGKKPTPRGHAGNSCLGLCGVDANGYRWGQNQLAAHTARAAVDNRGVSVAETAGNEFWKALTPIAKVFKPDGLRDAYIANAPSDDEKYYVPFTDTVSSRPLWISPSQNRWCDILAAKGAGLVNRHYHPHEVFAYTISGKWGYLEHDWTATAGDFVFEGPGESHTLVAYEHPDPMKVFFIVKGPLIWLDDEGGAAGFYDVHDYIAMCRAHYDKVGIGVDYITSLFR